MLSMDLQQNIQRKLTEVLAPEHLLVEDESHMHNVPEGTQSHFKVTVVADEFTGQPLVARHRRVFGILQEEMAGSLHALALHALSPEEWQQKPDVPESPPCRGGSKNQVDGSS